MHLLQIRSAQMDAFREERRRVVAAEVGENIRTRWPSRLALPSQPINDCVALSLEWSERRRATDRLTLEAVAAVFAAYGPPPWTAPFARPLADIHLEPAERVQRFVDAAVRALDEEEAAR
ncbi:MULTISPECIES: hypothetical protein [Myxococcus]|uniref:hypothetical protein n=1 Tax=Myxococcus TaxID=32 RepID=UPI0013D23F30|nr:MULTISPECIES: hypothetical protein [Myxococcus]NVJ22037.1 hypothetical protein [Myxococcus sp. AM011]